jgi:glycosyltransferase involved in cell wall biosynthesis
MSAHSKPRVIIFSDHLLYPSETFIHEQANALCTFEPVYAGSRRVVGLDLHGRQVHVINHGNLLGRCREVAFKLNGLWALPIAKHLNIPLIVTFHGSEVTLTDLRYQKRTAAGFRHYLANREKLSKDGTLFLVVSRFIRRKLLEQGFPEEKVLVHYTGVDTNKFQPANTEASPMILFVGRLEESKGAEFLIRAVAEVQKQMPAVELVVVGDGSLRAGLEMLSKQLLRRYRFLGSRTPEDVRVWMNRASVVGVPSITTRSGEEEGFGMVCAEAQAVAKPVVAFDSGGISEVVRHARTGFLAAEGDWRAMSEHLGVLLQDVKLRERFGLQGREWVLRQFDLEHRTRILEGIYARVSGVEPPPKEDGHGAILDSAPVRSSHLNPVM